MGKSEANTENEEIQKEKNGGEDENGETVKERE